MLYFFIWIHEIKLLQLNEYGIEVVFSRSEKVKVKLKHDVIEITIVVFTLLLVNSQSYKLTWILDKCEDFYTLNENLTRKWINEVGLFCFGNLE